MAQVLVRDLDPELLERLKLRARSHSRSLQAELKLILEQAAGPDMKRREEFRIWAAELRATLADIPQTDSVDLIREDRERREDRPL